jgi:AraC-like DNA-binding protein
MLKPGVSGQDGQAPAAGRPRHKPDDVLRSCVVQLRAEGQSIAEIAAAVDLAPNTLRRYYAAELATAPARRRADRPADPQLELLEKSPAPGLEQLEAAQPGRPAYEPTQAERDDVKLWAADDWTEDRMARQLGISRTTLRKYFEAEIEFGADQVRTQALRDLRRASRLGKVAASAKLLQLSGFVPPSAPAAAPLDRPDMIDDRLGKKERAQIDARTAEAGTSWASLLN